MHSKNIEFQKHVQHQLCNSQFQKLSSELRQFYQASYGAQRLLCNCKQSKIKKREHNVVNKEKCFFFKF